MDTTTLPLHRSTTDTKVGGVCGGIAEHLRIDPLLVRVAVVLLALSWGVGLTLYGLAWLTIPAQGAEKSLAEQRIPALGSMAKPGRWALAIAVSIATMVLFQHLLPFGLWPAIIVAGTVAVGRRQAHRAPLTQQRRGAIGSQPSEFEQLAAQWQARVAQTRTGASPLQATPYVYAPVSPQIAPGATRAARQRWQGWRILLPALALSITMAAALGVARSVAGWPIADATIGAAFLIPLSMGIIVSAFLGRSKATFAIAIAVALCSVGALTGSGTSTAGPIALTYTSITDMPARISADTGPLDVDLSRITLTEDTARTISHDFGPVTVVIPRDVRVVVNYSVDVGEFAAPGYSVGGMNSTGTWTNEIKEGPTLTLTINNDVGAVTIR